MRSIEHRTGHCPIHYREFYDVPRIFLVRSAEGSLLFESKFDSDADEYETEYTVYRMASDFEPTAGSWDRINERSLERIGIIPVAEVEFDETRRRSVNIDKIRGLLPPCESLV